VCPFTGTWLLGERSFCFGWIATCQRRLKNNLLSKEEELVSIYLDKHDKSSKVKNKNKKLRYN
jgi:hypothetical protein